jgi:hypothetical protein
VSVWRNWHTRWIQNPFPIKRSAGSIPVTDIMNTQENGYFIQWYCESDNCWYNHHQRNYNMKTVELIDYITSMNNPTRLFRIVCSNDLKIHSYWFNLCEVIPLNNFTVVCAAQGVNFVEKR